MVAPWLIYLAVVVISTAVSVAITALTAKNTYLNSENNKVDDLAVQTSDYGNMIPILYGTMRFAGEIIWCDEIKEHIKTTTSSSGGKGGGGKVKSTTTEYTYTVSLAILLCEGVINSISRIWADSDGAIDISKATYYSIYYGTEEQLPDPFIESIEGVGKVPAYRGLAYVVIKDFLLSNYGNRIPNFTFEVLRNNISKNSKLEDKITNMVIIPGSGEFIFDTNVMYYCKSYFNKK